MYYILLLEEGCGRNYLRVFYDSPCQAWSSNVSALPWPLALGVQVPVRKFHLNVLSLPSISNSVYQIWFCVKIGQKGNLCKISKAEGQCEMWGAGAAYAYGCWSVGLPGSGAVATCGALSATPGPSSVTPEVLGQMHVQRHGSHGTCMAPAGSCIIEIVDVKRQMHNLVYPHGIQFVFVPSSLSVLILTSCPAFLTDHKLYWLTEISGLTPDTEEPFLQLPRLFKI